MRECLVRPAEGDKPEVKFYKIYEPLNYQKQWRFSYTPDGIKPKQYINGLAELKAAYHEFNRREEAEYTRPTQTSPSLTRRRNFPRLSSAVASVTVSAAVPWATTRYGSTPRPTSSATRSTERL